MVYFNSPNALGQSLKMLNTVAALYLSSFKILLASLEESIKELDIDPDIEKFILGLDNKIKGKVYNEVRKNPVLTLIQIKEIAEKFDERSTQNTEEEFAFVVGLPEALQKWFLTNLAYLRRKGLGHLYEKVKSYKSKINEAFKNNDNVTSYGAEKLIEYIDLNKNPHGKEVNLESEVSKRVYELLSPIEMNDSLRRWLSNELPKYIEKEGKKDPSFILDSDPGLFSNLAVSFRDWQSDTNAKYIDKQFTHVKAEVDKWHTEQAKKLGKDVTGYDGSARLEYDFDNGWKIVEYISDNDLMYEGRIMNHCVGTYCLKKNERTSRIYSLRDPSDRSVLTIETDGTGALIRQVEGEERRGPNYEENELIKKWLDNKEDLIKEKILPAVRKNILSIKNPLEWVNKYPDEFTEDKVGKETFEIIEVLKYPFAIQYINNPSEKVQLAAVNQNGYAIKYINNPSEKVQLAAVNKNAYAIKFIKDPSEKVQLAAVSKYGDAIEFIKDPSEQVQLDVVNQNGNAIEFINNPSEKVQLAAVSQNGDAIEFIKDLSEAVQLDVVNQNGYFIKYINNPSEKVQLAAVNQNGNAMGYIKNPSEAVQLAAVSEYGPAIKYIKNPSEKVQLAAVNQNGYAIKYINNPSEKVQLAAVNKNAYAIKFIKDPSEKVQLAAVSKYGDAIEFIKDPSEQVQLDVVNQNGNAIEFINNPSEKVQLAAVSQNGDAIEFIKDLSEAVQLDVVNQNGYFIKYINNPSEKVQLAAVNQNGNAMGYIKNPSEAVQLAAVSEYGPAIKYIKNPSEKVQLAAVNQNTYATVLGG